VPEKGATLRVHLPVARAQRDDDSPAHLVTPPRALIVEDDEATRYFLARVLSNEGIEVVEATGLAEARIALAGPPVDLLVTDRALRDGDGLHLAREARRERRTRHVVLVSSDAQENGAVPESEVDAVLAKPLHVDRLLEMVRALLRY
jgi:DNA-binding response OmpR family regulator